MTKAYYSIERNGKTIATLSRKADAVKMAQKSAFNYLFWNTSNGKIAMNRKGDFINCYQ